MRVIKRDGSQEPVKFDKITTRIEALAYGLDTRFIDPTVVAAKTVEGVYDLVTTEEIDTLAAEIAATMNAKHHDYGLLAGRIAVSNLHKKTKDSFSETMDDLYNYVHPKTGKHYPLISDSLHKIAMKHSEAIDSQIISNRDFTFDYFAFKTLQRAYLLKIDSLPCERPSHMYMRVALAIHGEDLEAAFETYHLMSTKVFTHATPTLFNAGTRQQQMSSCFLVALEDDSMAGIFNTLKDVAMISKYAGGIGLHISNLRASGSFIAGSNSASNGLVPFLKVFNETARYSDQGGKRKGSFAMYLEPWHDDIFSFLEMRKNHGKEELRARDLFYAIWMPDLFMQAVESDSDWHLFCPNEAPGLNEVYGEEFKSLYNKYVSESKHRRVIKARDLWAKILESQIETGTPYIAYKDAANIKSNQKNLGTIKSSNLCCEVIQYSDQNESAVCNLASISLPAFIKNGEFNYKELSRISGIITRNLNLIIDSNLYPTEKTYDSNQMHRPIGIGVQGLADVFAMLKLPFESIQAKEMNKEIFAAIYYGALDASIELAAKHGHYESYKGSPASEGLLQFDLWQATPSPNWDWSELKERMAQHGLRNSLLVAPMPTASTSQILGNNECFEPYTSNIYTRRVLSGEFVIINKHLVNNLIELGLWNESVRNELIAANGSVQGINAIPDELKEIHKTVWEIKQKHLIDMSADRGIYVCQSQSLNIFMAEPNIAKLTSMHFYGWKAGLKTGMYYLRTKAATDAIKFTVETTSATGKAVQEDAETTTAEALVCSLSNPESCEACSG